jgi:sporulation protein YlmC with PRC-barrel domain
MTAAFAVAMAATMPMAFAQTATTTEVHGTTAAEHATITTNHVMPGQLRVTDMNGATVYDTQNKNIGDIKDVIVDRDGRIGAVILNVGSTMGMGGRLVAVGMSDLKVTTDSSNKPRFTVDRTESQLKSAQTFTLNRETTNSGSSAPPATTPAERR